MLDDNGLIAAFKLDGNGGGVEIDWHDIRSADAADGMIWVHLDRRSPDAQKWVAEECGLDDVVASALLAEETRPRSFSTQKGLFVVLRGVNLNPGADPEDMVSLRLWVEEHRVISVRIRRLMAVSDIGDLIKEGRGPKGAGDFLSIVTYRLIERMGPAIQDIVDAMDSTEGSLDDGDYVSIRKMLAELRHSAVILRRYLSPQREALGRIQMEQLPWLSQNDKLEIREVADRTLRYVEELDEIRERSIILQDAMLNELTMDMNRKMYVLTVIAAIILPLSFVAGLLGINVGGIPLAENKMGFWIVSVGLGIAGAIVAIGFRRLKWI